MKYNYNDKIDIISGMIRTLKIVNTLYGIYKTIEKKPLTISPEQNNRKQLYIDFCCRMQDELIIVNKYFKKDICAKKLLDMYNKEYTYRFSGLKINFKLSVVLKNVRDYYTHPNSYKKILIDRIIANKELDILIDEKTMEELFDSLKEYIKTIEEINSKELFSFSKPYKSTTMLLVAGIKTTNINI